MYTNIGHSYITKRRNLSGYLSKIFLASFFHQCLERFSKNIIIIIGKVNGAYLLRKF